MRTLAIGDVHGCLRALNTLLAAVAPGPEDLVITLGDYVDRGPDSRGVLDRLIALQSACRLVPLRGNHDQMMMEARSRWDPWWLVYGGLSTLASYGLSDPEDADLGTIPAAHWHFLDHDCVDWHETERHFFVHANACPDLPLAEQPVYLLRWERLIEPCEHFSGKVMICGHTKQAGGQPLNLGTTVCIDTGVYEPAGWLTCLDVQTGHYWQSSERGNLREGRLE